MWGRLAGLLAAVAAAGVLADVSPALAPSVYVEVTPGGPQPKVVDAVAGFSR